MLLASASPWRASGRALILASLATAMAALACPTSSAAQNAANHELWVGAIATEASWMVYSGGTSAPFGDLDGNGWRVRAHGGTGVYSFRGHQRQDDGSYAPLSYRDDVGFLDAMIGYHAQVGPLTAKFFAGATFTEHDVEGPADFTPEISGQTWGPKGQIELWLDPGGSTWASVNGSFTTLLDSYNLNARVGWRVLPNLSLGFETMLNNRVADEVDLAGAYASGGAFARYAWGTGEVSLSGGLTIDLDTDSTIVIDDPVSPYISATWLTKF